MLSKTGCCKGAPPASGSVRAGRGYMDAHRLPEKSGNIPNPNHPPPGACLKVEPITDLNAIARIKANLANNPRDLCLFTLGINTAYRACELVSITVGQVQHLKAGDHLRIRQSKNGKYRTATLNRAVIDTIQNWLKEHPAPSETAPLFRSKKTGEALTPITLTSMVKHWCETAGLNGQYGSHTLRKTWGYHQRKTFGTPTALLTRAYGHASEWQTLEYLCIQPEEIEELYGWVL